MFAEELSCRGRTMDQNAYATIIKSAPVPDVYPQGHHFTQDNDPKHTSKLAQVFIEEGGDQVVEHTCRVSRL